MPNTGGMMGIEAAVAAGIVAGKPEKQLEVIADIRQEQIQEISVSLNRHDKGSTGRFRIHI